MDVRSPSTFESGKCQACGQFFVREASLTKHLHNNCTAAHQRSKQLWKNAASNIKKLNAPRTASQKRIRDEVRPHDVGFELVCVRIQFYSVLIHVHFYSR